MSLQCCSDADIAKQGTRSTQAAARSCLYTKAGLGPCVPHTLHTSNPHFPPRKTHLPHHLRFQHVQVQRLHAAAANELVLVNLEEPTFAVGPHPHPQHGLARSVTWVGEGVDIRSTVWGGTCCFTNRRVNRQPSQNDLARGGPGRQRV